ncbi:MAG: IS5 family transposase [Alphaproteobacteria bacterium]|nr:IS5 family transposase [Alphaproteobacteria bacterium]MDP6660666.1 IS5 family transposase [Alphaproteobacteria bacterium]
MSGRYDLTDFEWSVIEPLLPNKPRGVPRVDDKRVLNGIFWVLRSGAPWRDLPERYGPYTTCYNRFIRWRKAGVWDRIMDAVSEAYDGDIQMIDSSVVRVHQCRQRKKNDRVHCMGRSRGGLTTKVHALTDSRGLPIKLVLTPGQTHDAKGAAMLLTGLPDGCVLLGDKAYDADWIRERIEAQGAAANIPDKVNRKHRHCFSKTLYKERNRIERFFNRIKHFRRVATRFEKHAANYLAMIKLASIRIWLRVNESMT